ARLRLDLDLGERLDLAGRHHRPSEVAFLDLGDPGRVELLAAAASRDQADYGQGQHTQADQGQALAALPSTVTVSVRHQVSNSLDVAVWTADCNRLYARGGQRVHAMSRHRWIIGGHGPGVDPSPAEDGPPRPPGRLAASRLADRPGPRTQGPPAI